jgi:hypothetical protein
MNLPLPLLLPSFPPHLPFSLARAFSVSTHPLTPTQRGHGSLSPPSHFPFLSFPSLPINQSIN